MVLLLEQCRFIVKRYHEAHSLIRVCADFVQEFPNSVSRSNHAILNLILKIQKWTRWFTVLGISIYGDIAKNVTERSTTSSQWLAQQVGFSYTSTYCKAIRFMENSKDLSIVLLLHTWWCFLFDMFFLSDETWFHLHDYKNAQIWTMSLHPLKIGIIRVISCKCVADQFFWDNYYRGISGGGVCSTDGSIPPTKTKSEKPRKRA